MVIGTNHLIQRFGVKVLVRVTERVLCMIIQYHLKGREVSRTHDVGDFLYTSETASIIEIIIIVCGDTCKKLYSFR